MRSWGNAFFDKGSFSKRSEFTGMCVGKLPGKFSRYEERKTVQGNGN